jgi:hypothetical protein
MGITVHYIDGAWVLHSLVLAFVPLHTLHTGKALCEVLVAACEQFNILPKILGITTDNAGNIGKLLECFEEACLERGVTFNKGEQHVRCVAHITNLGVQALLRAFDTEPSSAKSSEAETTQARKVSTPTTLMCSDRMSEQPTNLSNHNHHRDRASPGSVSL